MNKSRSSKSKLLMGVALVALLAGGVFVANRYFPAIGGYTAGTVAPMNRYQTNQVNGSDVVTADIECTNGVIHVIDTVLLPTG